MRNDRTRGWVCAVAAVMVLAATPIAVSAQETKLGVAGAQPLRDALKGLVGSKVSLRLTAGEEIGGTVAEVGENAVRLTEITGRELFDGLVRLDHVSAVIVRKAK
jgi:hypothetical protein